ncbi:NHL repeat-containing protein [Musa troglodytarum]|uniref:NHL repeat-containing protein n=1 Tax=Musa troglodytarum TaxID=320322 RepID=A0A9E7FEK6_9LILI|nr:NHL repeat-containing protein [Musa troglodytarum]
MDSAARFPAPEGAALVTADEMFGKRGCCCFRMPWPGTRARKAAERGEYGGRPVTGRWWWRRGMKVVTKVREWTEIVAGPRWKTFVRRFRRRPRHGGFGYDPLSYALNFDEGLGSDSDGESVRRGFSARYATPPASATSSMDLGGPNDAPPIVGDAHR